MSRRLFTMLLSELETIRVVCKHEGCGSVLELPASRLAKRFEGERRVCPACSKILFPEDQKLALQLLADAFDMLKNCRSLVDLEFVITDESTPPAGK